MLESQLWVVIDGEPVIPRTAEMVTREGVKGYVIVMEHAIKQGESVTLARGLSHYADAQSFVHYLNSLRGGAFELHGREPEPVFDWHEWY